MQVWDSAASSPEEKPASDWSDSCRRQVHGSAVLHPACHSARLLQGLLALRLRGDCISVAATQSPNVQDAPSARFSERGQVEKVDEFAGKGRLCCQVIYESETHNGVGELLEILGSIINGCSSAVGCNPGHATGDCEERMML